LKNARWSSRFTPTGVGTTARKRQRRDSIAVHPHGRGDHSLENVRNVPSLGSPPRAWGPQLTFHPEKLWERFTPTGVGTTRSAPAAPQTVPVHPHGRGDHPFDPQECVG